MKDLEYYLGLPYTIILKRDEEGDIVAHVDELRGCSAHGKTASGALANLEESKRVWVEDCLEAGQEVPEPAIAEMLPSGKWVQRVARSLHKKLTDLAKREGTSLNQFVATVLAEAVGQRAIKPSVADAEPADWAAEVFWSQDVRSGNILLGNTWDIQEPERRLVPNSEYVIENLPYLIPGFSGHVVRSLKKVDKDAQEKERDHHLKQ
jgi:antitoxin HicB